jgi:cytochrome o ubiquinol oxidase subunit 3
MSRKAAKYPGLNLSSAHGKDHEAAESLMFGFWVFLMSDAILFGMVFATYVTFGRASLALKYKHSTPRLIGWLAATLILGVAFLCFELHDFSTMFAKGGVPSRSGFLSAFFDLVPLHGLHVAGGCIWLICLVGQIARYGLDTKAKLGIMRLALFWHFLDIVWIAIFSVVYLAGLT